MVRVLLAGLPRSGTSWAGEALGHTSEVAYVDEPDGFRDAFAFRVMMQYGENPALTTTDTAPEYERLWAGAFAGGRAPSGPRARLAQRAYLSVETSARQKARSGSGVAPALRIAQRFAQPPQADPNARHILVKSVQCARSLDWIHHHFEPRIVILLRNPLNALASWRDLGFVGNPLESADLADEAQRRWGISAPNPDAPSLAHQSFTFGALTESLLSTAEKHPEWIVVRHEVLCEDAPNRFRALAEQLGLTWTEEAETFVRDSDREGQGYATKRVAGDQPLRWRERLSDDDVEVIRGVLAQFPHGSVIED